MSDSRADYRSAVHIAQPMFIVHAFEQIYNKLPMNSFQ